jgi:hypothetical protein
VKVRRGAAAIRVRVNGRRVAVRKVGRRVRVRLAAGRPTPTKLIIRGRTASGKRFVRRIKLSGCAG